MKKGVITIIAILLTFIFGIVFYFLIWGDKPQIENFDDISGDYEIVAKASMEYYNELSDKDERITLFTYDDCMKLYNHRNPDENIIITLNEEEKEAIKTVNKEFSDGALWVTEDYVIFWQDETKYYGLIYSKNPLSIIWDMKSDWYESVEYHRINSNWYEIGVFGI